MSPAMQQVPARHVLALAGQLVEAGAAPHVGLHAPVGGEQLLRPRIDRAQDRAQPSSCTRLSPSAPALHRYMRPMIALCPAAGPAWRSSYASSGCSRRFPFSTMRFQAVPMITATPVREGRVSSRSWEGSRCGQAVLVLQAFAVERGAARGAAQQEAARLHVARRPGQVANALPHAFVEQRLREARAEPGPERDRVVCRPSPVATATTNFSFAKKPTT